MATIKEYGGQVTLDYELFSQTKASKSGAARTVMAMRTWLAYRLGHDYFETVVAVGANQNQGIRPADDALMKSIAGLPDVSDFNFIYWPSKITADGFSRIQNLKKLKYLRMTDANLPASALRHLAKLSELEEIDIDVVDLQDDDLKPLAGLTQLRTLTIRGGTPGDAGLAHLEGLIHLGHLSIGGRTAFGQLKGPIDPQKKNRITSAGLVALKRMQSLSSLTLISTRITSIAELGALPSLTRLNLQYSLVDDAGLEKVTGFPKLVSLNLSSSEVGDASCDRFAAFPRLTDLHLGKTHVTDVGLEPLSKNPRLRTLSLDGDTISDAGVMQLAVSPLRAVNVSNTNVTTTGAAALRKSAPTLFVHGLK